MTRLLIASLLTLGLCGCGTWTIRLETVPPKPDAAMQQSLMAVQAWATEISAEVNEHTKRLKALEAAQRTGG